MRLIHVNRLQYDLVTTDDILFEGCPPIIIHTVDFTIQLDKDVLLCEFLSHFASISEARGLVEPYLRRWEMYAAIKHGYKSFCFIYHDADVVEIDPVLCACAYGININEYIGLSLSATVRSLEVQVEYPTPCPGTFTFTPDVETLWFRYNLYLDGKEPLQSMAYFCLSYLEFLAGTRSKAVELFQIDRVVLNHLGELTSEKGDRKTARKGKANSFEPLTIFEVKWIEKCIRALISRLGEMGSEQFSALITMKDI